MDIVDSQRRSAMMAAIGPRHTLPELRVRRVAHRMGFRFRLHAKTLPGCPDMVLARHRTVVFVHGCFWHRHEGCANAVLPKTRRAFWVSKFEKNVDRDSRAVAALRAMGWRVVVIWECETEDTKLVERRLLDALHRRKRHRSAER
jgi:DNA mismatch endonuclease (patch repair protein)